MQQKYDELELELGNLKLIIEDNDQAIEHIKARIKETADEINKDEAQLVKVGENKKELLTKKNQTITTISNVQRQLIQGLTSLRRTNPTTRGFIVPESYSIANASEVQARKDKVLRLNKELNIIKHNISLRMNLTTEYVKLLRLSNDTLGNLKASLEANQSLLTSNYQE